MKIALAGNPNSGKTTMFNVLTGKNEKVGNWAGVTVSKKEALIKKSLYQGEDELVIVDLPGAYSMSPFTMEEVVASDYVKNENPDVIINIVDGTNLSRSLFFTTQLLELGIPLVVALNKSDINKKKETVIDTAQLSAKLLCPVVETSSTTGEGITVLIEKALSVIGFEQKAPYIQGSVDYSNRSAVSQADKKRFHYVNEVVQSVEKRKVLTKDKNYQDVVDDYLTNKWLGIPIFVVIMFVVFWISQVAVGPVLANGLTLSSGKSIPGIVTLIEWFGELVTELMVNSAPILQAIVIDGIIGGVGAVLGFLPLVMVMYFLLALLEDCGYMARVSVVLDPIFKKVGLSGKSVIPMIIGTGCAIPGIMACRTIRDEKERCATAMLTPFIPCGAKIPVIALISGLFFNQNQWWVSPLMYFLGIILVFFCALLVRWLSGTHKKKSYFIIELPEYKFPDLWKAFLSMLERGKAYLIKAGTVILICNAVITIMLNFNWQFQIAETPESSILHFFASPIAVLLIPLGFGTWQLTSAAITGFIAKEEVVATLGAVFTSLAVNEEFELLQQGNGQEVLGISAVAGLSYLMFNLFTPPCFAAIGAMNSEIKSKKWFFGGIALQLCVGYTLSYFVNQIGTLICYKKTADGALVGGVTVFALAFLTFTIGILANHKQSKRN